MKKEIKLNLGCGVHLFEGFINVDNSFSLKDLTDKKGIYGLSKIDKDAEFIQADMCKLPIKDNTVDYIECLEAIEHVPYMKVEKAVREMHRVLKPGGKTVIFTTDFDDIAKMWVDFIANKDFNPLEWFTMVSVIYGNQLTSGEHHRAAFNTAYLNGLMQTCGFKDFTIVIYPRGAFPPKFRGAKWPEKAMATGMILIEAVKS